MMDEVKPDIVALGLRWVDRHAELAIEAARRGIHIYMEKPFCRTLGEADAIIDALNRSHTKLVVCHPTRFSPVRDTVARLIKEGKIGKVLEYRARGKEDHRGGGEDLWVLGTHTIDLIRSFGGRPTWCFATLTQGGRPVTKTDIKPGNEGLGPLAGDSCQVMWGMPDGSIAHFGSHRNAGRRQSRYGLQIMGSDGVMEILEGPLAPCQILLDAAWSPGRTGAKWQRVTSGGIGVPEPIGDLGPQSRHIHAMKALTDAIENNTESQGGPKENRDNLEMIMAVFESVRQGRPVPLPISATDNPLSRLA
jgi:predicted dehydrogenase